jgi:hypothetical protein
LVFLFVCFFIGTVSFMTIMTLDISPLVIETDSGDGISKTTKRTINNSTNTNGAVGSRSPYRRKTGGVRRAISGGPSLSSVRREAEKLSSSSSSFSQPSLPLQRKISLGCNQPNTPKRSSSGDRPRKRLSPADRQRLGIGGSSAAGSDDGTVNSANSFDELTTISLKSDPENEPHQKQQQQKNIKEHSHRRNRSSDSSLISRLTCNDGDSTSTFSSPLPSANSSTGSILGTSNKSKSKRRSSMSMSSSSQLGDATTTTTATTSSTTATDDSSRSSSDKRRDSSDKKSSSSRRSNSIGKYSEKGKQNARSRRMARAASSDNAVVDEATVSAITVSATATPKSGRSQRVPVSENEILQLLSSSDCELPLVTGEEDDKKPSSKKLRSGRSRGRRSSSPNDNGDGDCDGDDKKNLKLSKSLVNRKDRSSSKDKSGDVVPSIKKQEVESDTTTPQSGKTELNQREYGIRRSNSAGALKKTTRQLRRSSNDNGEKERRHRKPPIRSRSDDLASENGMDNGLDNFLKHSVTVSRRKKGASGSRSVASAPIRQHKSRRHHRPSDPNSSSSKAKPINSDDVLEEGDDEDQSDSEVDHNRSLDLDLATARGNFGEQQHLNEKLQLHLSKTDELLYSVFPKHVADALRNGQKVAPENHDIVTIFFCDIGKYYDFKQKQKVIEYFYSNINAMFTFVVSH